MAKKRIVPKKKPTLTSMFEKQGDQFLKFHFTPYLNQKEKTSMRATCKSLKQKIPAPKYSYHKSLRLEKNTGCVESKLKNEKFSSVESELNSNVIKIFSNRLAFAALKSSGKLITWRNTSFAGLFSVEEGLFSVRQDFNSNVVDVFSSSYAFAALKSNGKLLTWGSTHFGGDSSAVREELNSNNVVKVFSNCLAFAALKSNGKLVTWGYQHYGGDSSSVREELNSNIVEVFSTSSAFAALKSNGKLITWGHPRYGGDSSSVRTELNSNVLKIVSTYSGFAALKSNGKVVSWGEDTRLRNSLVVPKALLSSGVIQIESLNNKSFRATKNDGTQVTWG